MENNEVTYYLLKSQNNLEDILSSFNFVKFNKRIKREDSSDYETEIYDNTTEIDSTEEEYLFLKLKKKVEFEILKFEIALTVIQFKCTWKF
jgi:hypothetical protein